MTEGVWLFLAWNAFCGIQWPQSRPMTATRLSSRSSNISWSQEIYVLLSGTGKVVQIILEFKLSPCSNVICFLLDNSPASEFYIPTFRNTLSVPSSSWCGVFRTVEWVWPFPPHRGEVLLISNFRRVLNVVCFLLGNSPEAKFYMPTFRNTLFHLFFTPACLWRWNSVPKRRHIKLGRREIVQIIFSQQNFLFYSSPFFPRTYGQIHVPWGRLSF
jgi:hypothetical protein